jgi:F0F1-type ATP synthase assembly protein I
MTDNQNPKKKTNNSFNFYARFSSIAIQMFVIIGIGTFGGVKLDEYFQNKNDLFTIILSLLSVILSILYVVRSIISSPKDKE